MDEIEPAADLPESESLSRTEPPVSEQPAELLTEADFVPDEPLKPPGPGIPESLGWVFGLVALQIVGGVVGLILAIISDVATTGSQELLRNLRDPSQQQAYIQQLVEDPSVALFLGTQTVFLFGVLLAAAVRLGRTRPQSLPLAGVPLPHLVIVGIMLIPLMLLGQSLFQYAMEYWELFVSYLPGLKRLTESSSMDQIALLAPKTSLPLLMFLVAFVPAVAEELVFRGVIGRGLVARWGLPAGVLMTSILFAAVHLHPVHAFALMPLAVCIHLAYLSTRSFWTPMAIHFINNGCGVLALKLLEDSPEVTEQAASEDPSLSVFITAIFLIVALSALLWQMRVRFIHPDGTEWSPGYDGADVPPNPLSLEKQYARPDWRLLTVCGASAIAFLTAIVITSVETVKDAV